MNIGYKATWNYKCLNQLYEIGQEYKLDGPPILCEKGFHYCKIAQLVLSYYNYDKGFKLLEIEDLSDETIHNYILNERHHEPTEYDKSCSNHIRIIREITDPDELFGLLGKFKTFNEHGDVLTFKDSNGSWSKSTYNEQRQILTHEDHTGESYEYIYNEQGKVATYNYKKDYAKFWYEKIYYPNGYLKSYSDSYGRISNYDTHGNLTF
jgi:YD repeat-containing protein